MRRCRKVERYHRHIPPCVAFPPLKRGRGDCSRPHTRVYPCHRFRLVEGGSAGRGAPKVALAGMPTCAFDAGISAGFMALTAQEILKNFLWPALSSGLFSRLWLGLIGLLARLIGCGRWAEELVDLAAQAFSHGIDQFLLGSAP